MSLASAWEDHADEWIAWARTSAHDGFWTGTWPALRAMLPGPGAGPVIDVGCGEGRAARELAKLGYHRIVGVERSPTLAAAAAAASPGVPVLKRLHLGPVRERPGDHRADRGRRRDRPVAPRPSRREASPLGGRLPASRSRSRGRT